VKVRLHQFVVHAQHRGRHRRRLKDIGDKVQWALAAEAAEGGAEVEGDEAPTSVSLSDQDLVQVLEDPVTGLSRGRVSRGPHSCERSYHQSESSLPIGLELRSDEAVRAAAGQGSFRLQNGIVPAEIRG
jgi:hypothetical protein